MVFFCPENEEPTIFPPFKFADFDSGYLESSNKNGPVDSLQNSFGIDHLEQFYIRLGRKEPKAGCSALCKFGKVLS